MVTNKSEKKNAPALVIVESPAKARTINKYLGSGYIVKASMGHVRDLPKSGIGVDVDANFAPTYEVLPTRKKLITELRSDAKKASTVFLATDLDREGEAIAWHLCYALGLTPESAQRVVFNEITPTAIRRAFEHPRKIDQSKVNAQQARRILDRLVGYKVSPLLWKKVARDLSAGRVQSVAVKLIVDREREILAFMPEEYWKIQAVFTTSLKAAAALRLAWQEFTTEPDDDDTEDGTDAPAVRTPNVLQRGQWMADNQSFRADLVEFQGKKFDPKNADDAIAAAMALGLAGISNETAPNDGSNGPRGIPARGPAQSITKVRGDLPPIDKPPFVVRNVTSRPSTSKPPGPFSTSTLQQAASNQLGFAAQRTMRIAQQLYEGVEVSGQGAVGLITYMRTDSQNISGDALQAVRKFIKQSFSAAYLPDAPNVYASRQGAQEAHEAIRPTDVELTPDRVRGSLNEEQHKLYELIWKRFVACQMTSAQWRINEAFIICRAAAADAAPPPVFKATGRQLEFDGFTRVAGINSRFGEQVLPPLVENQKVVPLDILPSQHFTSPPPRFTEATLVKALESEGIGRPSTYASIIGTIRDRHYVDQVSPRDRRFCATDLGMKVTEKLVEGFPDLMELGFTRRVEGQLDQIEDASEDWVSVVRSFYEPLARDLATAEQRMTHARAEATPSPYKCPKCDAPMVYKLAKRGKTFLSCSRYPECDGGSSVDREGKPVELEITEYKCPACTKPMIKRQGRFGPFFGCSGYPECKVIQAADRNTGEPLPPRPPPKPTGLKCPRCNKKDLVVRAGKRGEFISCSGYPRCRMTLPAERLPEFLDLAAKNLWPPPDIFAKAARTGGKAAKEPAAAAEEAAAAPAVKTPKKRRLAKTDA